MGEICLWARGDCPKGAGVRNNMYLLGCQSWNNQDLLEGLLHRLSMLELRDMCLNQTEGQRAFSTPLILRFRLLSSNAKTAIIARLAKLALICNLVVQLYCFTKPQN